MKTSIYKNVGIPILLSVVGSIVWTILSDYIIPAFTSYYIKFSVAYSKKVYASISTHDLIALQQSTYSLLSLLLVIVSILVCAWSYINMSKYREEYESAKARLKALISKESEEETSEEFTTEAIKDLLESSEKTDKFYNKVYILNKILLPTLLIFSILISFKSVATAKYVYESVSYFDYLMGVNSILLDEKKERNYKSRFSQIRNGQDYRNIVVELEKLALSNGLSILPNTTVRKDKDLKKDHPSIKAADVTASDE